MSHYDYRRSIHIAAQDEPFYALLMACMRQADTNNLEKLKREWPHVWAELDARYNSPGGYINDEEKEATNA